MANLSPTHLQAFVSEYVTGLKSVVDSLSPTDVHAIIASLSTAYEKGQRIFVVGNGGSAATASHLACDLSKTILGNKPQSTARRFAVIALTDNMPLVTAWANDASYDLVFSEPLRNLACPGDLLLVITGSGNSKNIIEVVKAARELGVSTIGLLGFSGGAVKPLLDHTLVVASNNYGHIEDAHMILTHLITAYFKAEVARSLEEKLNT
jgi:D-sedoheptulose 7-phosphate isomerase